MVLLSPLLGITKHSAKAMCNKWITVISNEWKQKFVQDARMQFHNYHFGETWRNMEKLDGGIY